MLKINKTILGFTLLLASVFAQAQSNSYNNFSEDETTLYRMNKQVGQFVKRFNLEEDQYGKTLPSNDKKYHNNAQRKKMLPGLFDQYNARTSGELRKFFIDDVTNNKNPIYLNFLDENWYAELSVTFLAGGDEVNIILYLTLEEENKGSKWIISNVYYSYFPQLFPRIDSAEFNNRFLHPQSHELDFMNLHKALEDPGHIEYYASGDYRPDFLTLFFYQMKTGKLKFKEINSVKFHFFQIKNWYFELSWFNRNNDNSGWLISNLKYVDDNTKKELIKFYRICASDK